MSHIKNLACPPWWTCSPWRAAGIMALMVCVFISGPGRANNITVSNVKRFGQVPGSHWMVLFNISWTNSWRCDLVGGGQAEPYNYDAAWVFIKWRTNDPSAGITGNWYHASLSTNASDHVAPAGSMIEVGRDGRKDEWGTNGVGVFIYRNANGSGTFTANKTQLRWNHAANGVADSAPIELKVCAIEMVYVTTGAFYVGSATNGTEQGRFIEGYLPGASNNMPFRVQDELQISVSNEPGCLWGVYSGLFGGNYTIGTPGVLSNAYPKGCGAFYGMKHEITQGQYVDFLNMLTRDQQANRFFSTTVSNFMCDIATNIPIARNGVQLISTNAPYPRVYANNLDTNNAPNSTNDGQWIVCNYISWPDTAAYLDWAGLRPMTELEFEKACRGTNAPIAFEYAWTTNLTAATNILYSGTANERPGNAAANCVYNNGVSGPMRVGCLGISTGSRTNTGAGYYGMLELSGNMCETLVSVGGGISAAYVGQSRSFTGRHGDGRLTAAGDADVALWPTGCGSRGGAYSMADLYIRVAARQNGGRYENTRYIYTGARGCRTKE